jgi:hypothetical protein
VRNQLEVNGFRVIGQGQPPAAVELIHRSAKAEKKAA